MIMYTIQENIIKGSSHNWEKFFFNIGPIIMKLRMNM